MFINPVGESTYLGIETSRRAPLNVKKAVSRRNNIAAIHLVSISVVTKKMRNNRASVPNACFQTVSDVSHCVLGGSVWRGRGRGGKNDNIMNDGCKACEYIPISSTVHVARRQESRAFGSRSPEEIN